VVDRVNLNGNVFIEGVTRSFYVGSQIFTSRKAAKEHLDFRDKKRENKDEKRA
jgi:hypothetical protein